MSKGPLRSCLLFVLTSQRHTEYIHISYLHPSLHNEEPRVGGLKHPNITHVSIKRSAPQTCCYYLLSSKHALHIGNSTGEDYILLSRESQAISDSRGYNRESMELLSSVSVYVSNKVHTISVRINIKTIDYCTYFLS